MQAVHNNTFLIPHTVTMTFLANSILLSVSILEDIIWCHSINYCLDPNSKWGIQVLNPTMTISNRKLTSSVTMPKTSVAIFFLAFSCASFSIHGTQHTQTFRKPSSAIIAITPPLAMDR